MSETDSVLLNRWLVKRDPDAFKAIVGRYAGMVYGTCRRILDNATEAEDVAQECFEILVSGNAGIRTYLGPWLHQVAVNRSLNRTRSERGRKEREHRFATSCVTSERDAVWDDICEFVDDAIIQLPDKLRVPIVAHFLEDRTHESIAQALGLSRQTVTYRINKGVELIRKSLKRRGVTLASLSLMALLKANVAQAAPSGLVAALGKYALAGPITTAPSATVLAVQGTTLSVKWLAIAAAALLIAGVGGFFAAQRVLDQPDAALAALSVSEGATSAAVDLKRKDHQTRTSTATDVRKARQKPQEAVLASTSIEDGSAGTEPGSNEPGVQEDRIIDPALYASISGVVSDESGNRIPGAEIVVAVGCEGRTVDSALALADMNRHFRGETGAEGRYEVTGISYTGAAIVRAYAAGRTGTELVRIDVCGALKDINITVSDTVVLNGKVIAPNSAPVPDALVSVLGFLQTGGGYDEFYSANPNLAYTDAQGMFHLGFLKEGMSALQVTAAGFAKSLFQDIAVGDPNTVSLKIQESATLRGRITYGDGRPATGLTVHLAQQWIQYANPGQHEGHQNYGGGEGPRYMADTDAGGDYVIPDIGPGTDFQVQVRSRWKPSSPGEEVGPFLPGETRIWDHTIQEEITIRGHVIGATTGRPIAGACAYYRKMDLDELTGTYATTTFDGAFEITLVGGSGTYILEPRYFTSATVEDILQDPWTKLPECDAGETYTIDLPLPEPATFPIRVVDAGGSPVVGAEVSAFVQEPNITHIIGMIGATDSEGRFVCSTVPPDLPVWTEVKKPGLPSAISAAYVGSSGEVLPEQTLIMAENTFGITGTAIAPDGMPAASRGITAFPQTPGQRSRHPLYTTTDEQGVFHFRETLPETTEGLSLYLDVEEGRNPGAEVNPVEIVPGQSLDLGRVVFVPSQ